MMSTPHDTTTETTDFRMPPVSEADHIEGVAHEIGAEVIRAAPTLAVMPQVEASELVGRLNVIREAMKTAMAEGVDYGVIPGTDKPTLLKPGAEKLGVLFQLDVQLVNEKQWGPDDHLTVMSRAIVHHAPTGLRLGYGEGLCTTRERKYAKRKQERSCPACGAEAVIKGKAEYGGGWLCWRKRGGCGAKYGDGDPKIEGQTVGDIDNPDLPDLWNTVVKMAEKRARVDAVLAVTGASALFTQDVEDMQPSAAEQAPQPPPPEPRSDVTPPATVSADRAGTMLLNAKSAGVTLNALHKAVEHAYGRNLPPFDSDEIAFQALGKLTVAQGERVDRWIEKKREAATFA